MDFFDNIDQNVEWDKPKKNNKIEQDTAKINAAPTNDVIAETPDINLNQNEQNVNPINSNTSNIGDNLFSKAITKPNTPIEQDKQIDLPKEINKDNRSNEQIIEDYVENNPEEAKIVIPKESDLYAEAEQVNDGDKRTDEVRNDVVEQFIEDEPELANEIVEEAADDNSVLERASNDDDKSIVSDQANIEANEEDFDILEDEQANKEEQLIKSIELDEKDQQIEDLYQQGKEKLINTRPTDKWDIDRIESFKTDLDKAVESIDVNDPESIHKLAKLERKRRQLLRAITTKKEIEQKQLSEVNNNVIDPIEQELIESAIDPAEAIYSLQQDEQKEADARMADYIKEANEITRKRLGQYEDDPAELKKLNDADKQLAIYSDKALMELQKTEEVIKEKEEKIRKKFGLPRIPATRYNTSGASNSGFSQKQYDKPDEPITNNARLSSVSNKFPTGNSSAAVNSNGAGLNKRLEAAAKDTSPTKSIGPNPLIEQIEQPSASTKGNKYENSSATPAAKKPGSLVGWASVNNKGGGRFAATKGKAPKFSNSSSANNTNKLSAKKQADARNITKKEVAQKILAESKNWQVNERGEKDSGADLLPVRLYVKDDKIEVSIVGTGRKRKSLDSVNDQELALIDKQI